MVEIILPHVSQQLIIRFINIKIFTILEWLFCYFFITLQYLLIETKFSPWLLRFKLKNLIFRIFLIFLKEILQHLGWTLLVAQNTLIFIWNSWNFQDFLKNFSYFLKNYPKSRDIAPGPLPEAIVRFYQKSCPRLSLPPLRTETQRIYCHR